MQEEACPLQRGRRGQVQWVRRVPCVNAGSARRGRVREQRPSHTPSLQEHVCHQLPGSEDDRPAAPRVAERGPGAIPLCVRGAGSPEEKGGAEGGGLERRGKKMKVFLRIFVSLNFLN